MLCAGQNTDPSSVVWGRSLLYTAMFVEDDCEVVSSPSAGRRCQRWGPVCGPHLNPNGQCGRRISDAWPWSSGWQEAEQNGCEPPGWWRERWREFAECVEGITDRTHRVACWTAPWHPTILSHIVEPVGYMYCIVVSSANSVSSANALCLCRMLMQFLTGWTSSCLATLCLAFLFHGLLTWSYFVMMNTCCHSANNIILIVVKSRILVIVVAILSLIIQLHATLWSLFWCPFPDCSAFWHRCFGGICKKVSAVNISLLSGTWSWLNNNVYQVV